MSTKFVKKTLTLDGSSSGLVFVDSTAGFTIGAIVYLGSNAVAAKSLIINKIPDSRTLVLKEYTGFAYGNYDCSPYLVIDGATVTQPNDQSLPEIQIPEYPANQPISGDSQVTLTKSILSGEVSELSGVYKNVKVNNFGSLAVEIAAGANVDAFQRLRVAYPTVLFDSKLINDAQPIFWDDQQVSGSGTSSVYNSTESSVSMSVSNLLAGTRIRQTFRRMVYQPGKSQFIAMTGIIGSPQLGITRDIGYGDNNNGIFFRSSPTSVGVVLRTSTSGAPVDAFIPQNSWNIDRMDGTGASGISIDWTKTHIFAMQFQWLGVGSVWFGLDIGGQLIWAHRIDNANSQTKVYMQNPNLPCRYLISNDGTGGVASIKQVCSAVISEGGLAQRGFSTAIVRDVGMATLNNSNWYPVISVRFKPGFEDVNVDFKKVNLVCSSNAVFAWRLVMNPTIIGTALSFANVSNSALQADITSTNATTVNVSSGTIWDAGVNQQTNESITITLGSDDLKLGSSIAGVSDVMVLAVQRLTGSSETFYASITINEFA